VKDTRALIRKVLGALIVAASGAGAWGVQNASAALACRSDPIVVLSNGTTLDLHATFNNGVTSTISHVTYVLHGPALPATTTRPTGSTASGLGWYSYSYPDGSGSWSTMSYIGDEPNSGGYDAYITVTAASTIPITAYMDWLQGGGTPHAGISHTGTSGQTLHVHLQIVSK
jgi:hypothetical protein